MEENINHYYGKSPVMGNNRSLIYLEMVGLETAAFQLGIFDEIPQKMQMDDLAKLVMKDDGIEEFESLVAAYLEEDIEELYDLITENEMFKEYGNLLLDDRNAN